MECHTILNSQLSFIENKCLLDSSDFNFINKTINDIFDKTSDNLKLFFHPEKVGELSEKISIQSNNHSQVEIIAKIKNVWLSVGIVKFVFRWGKSLLAPDETSELKSNDYNAMLDYIKIFDEFQGTGLGSKALKLWLSHMDELKIPLIILGIDSKIPYAASLYQKVGFKFTKQTMISMISWYNKLPESECRIQKTGAEALHAQNEFLADSTRKLDGSTVFMIRYNPNF